MKVNKVKDIYNFNDIDTMNEHFKEYKVFKRKLTLRGMNFIKF
jgi:hypothetical protein